MARYESLKSNHWYRDLLPKGLAWRGENTQRLVKATNDWWNEAVGQTVYKAYLAQDIDTAPDEVVDDYFDDINYSLQIFTGEVENKRPIVKLFLEKRRWLSEDDYIEIGERLGFTVDIVRGIDAFADPSLVAPTPAPLTEENAKFIVYLSIEGAQSSDQGFDYVFDFTFGGEISTGNLIDLYRTIAPLNVELRTFTTTATREKKHEKYTNQKHWRHLLSRRVQPWKLRGLKSTSRAVRNNPKSS